MRKLPLIIVSILIVAGGAYALIPTLFPDTPGLPRVPTGAGTIGSIIAKLLGTIDIGNYGGDGKVANSLALSGVTGSGYLKNTECTNISEKWIGIDADGKALCGVSTPLLVDYGTIDSQGCPADIYHLDSGAPDTTNTGDTLKSGDIIKTGACGLTIAFSDLSILRLDADTTVSLDVATTPSNQTIASAILSNGSLWGRILTETGSYSIGTDKIVAGVRGTSVSVTSTGDTVGVFTYQTGTGWTFPITRSTANQTELNVLDSTTTISAGGTYAATVFCVNEAGKRFIAPGMIPGKKIRIPHTGCPTTPPLSDEDTKTSYIGSQWIRKNTQKDIRYMYDTLAYSGNSLGTKREKINQELTNTQPPGDHDPEALNICEAGYRWWTPRYGCQEEGLYAIADYTKPSLGSMGYPDMERSRSFIYSSGGTEIIPATIVHVDTPTEGSGIYITGTNYIQYTPVALIDLNSLSGKTIKIGLDAIPTSTSTLLDLGQYVKIQRYIPAPPASPNWQCKFDVTGFHTCTLMETSIINGIEIGVYIPPNAIPNIDKFIIGNNSNTSFSFPIKKTIKYIKI